MTKEQLAELIEKLKEKSPVFIKEIEQKIIKEASQFNIQVGND